MNRHHTLIAKLMDLVEEIAQNVEYPEFFVNDRCLVDHNTYLKLCLYIFPELKPHLDEIESIEASPAEKINFLLELLSEALQYDFSNVDGFQIARYNINHIQRLVGILHEYSKIVKENANKKPKIRSEEASSSEKRDNVEIPHSARERKEKKDVNSHQRKPIDKQRKRDLYHQEGEQDQDPNQKHIRYADTNDYLIPSEPQSKNKSSKRKGSNRKTRHQKALKENLHEKVVKSIMKEKTRMLDVQNRDNRKNKKQFLKQAKDKYKVYLYRYAKDNRAKNSRDAILAIKSASAVKPIKEELPRKDFDKIQNFFQSFAYQFRDKKEVYLRKITQLIRKQELDRFCYQNKIEREAKKYMEERLHQELEASRHQHRVKSQMLKESAKNLENQVIIMKKEAVRAASAQKRELKEAKKKELEQIENVLRDNNEKVLMSLEEGGRLQQLIMKMYKKL